MKRISILSIIVLFTSINHAQAQTTNSWTSMGAGFWHSAGNWSAGVPSNNQALVQITNAVSKAAFINATTTNSPGTLTISNLFISAPAGTINELQLANSGTNVPLRILNRLSLTTGGVLTISNAEVDVFQLGGSISAIDGAARIDNGVLKSISLEIGNTKTGSVVVNSGTMYCSGGISVGASSGGLGTLTVAGGVVTNSNTMGVGSAFNATGTVWITGGEVTVPDGVTYVGYVGTGRMTISNGAFRGSSLSIGESRLGTLTVAGGTVHVKAIFAGLNLTTTGAVWVTGGQVVATNNFTSLIGPRGTGQLVISNGDVRVSTLAVSDALSSVGTVTVAGGTLAVDRLVATNNGAVIKFAGGVTTLRESVVTALLLTAGTDGRTSVLNLLGPTNQFRNVFIGYQANSTGTVWFTGKELITSNDLVSVGYTGVGQMTISNGTWRAGSTEVGVFSGNGTLRFAGSTNHFRNDLFIGDEGLYSTGEVWMTSGVLTNGLTFVGREGAGRMTISNGTFRGRAMLVGVAAGSRGTFTVAGGVSSVYSNLTIGYSGCTSTGVVNLISGALRVTNDTASSVLDVRGGTLTHSGGTLDIDRLIITNTCGRFVHTGGTLITGLVTLTPNYDADGDGIINSYEQSNGLDPFDPTDAGTDNDGDGQSNLEEYTMGTDPNDANSFLHITSIVVTNNTNILITWPIAPTSGNGLYLDYYVQWGTNLLTGVTNNLSFIAIGPGAPSQTNYLDVGGATNRPTRFYRIKGFID